VENYFNVNNIKILIYSIWLSSKCSKLWLIILIQIVIIVVIIIIKISINKIIEYIMYKSRCFKYIFIVVSWILIF